MKSAILSLLLCSVAPAQVALTLQNAASDAVGPVAPDSAVSAFALGLTTQTTFATTLPLPTTLGGVSVQVTDSLNTARPALLIFVSPSQINFIVPTGVATGMATVREIGRAHV